MSSWRSVYALTVVVAALCAVLLTCAPTVAGRQLLGVSFQQQSFNATAMGQNNLVYFVGDYELPAGVTSTASFSSFDFDYTVPDQQGATTPNYVRFAVYDDNGSNSPVAQSALVTIHSGIRGAHTVVGHIQGTAGALSPSTKYRIGQRADRRLSRSH